MKESENQVEQLGKWTCSRFRISMGELMPWGALCIMAGIFLACKRWPCQEDFDLWSLVLIPVYGLFVCWLFGRNLNDNPNLLSIKEHIRNVLVLVVCAGSFLCGYFGITLLVIGATVVVVATSCLACFNSWLFRFRGGRMIGLFVLFLVASILYHKLELKTEHCEYEKNAMVEPIHIANQLVGVALPSRGHLGKDGSTLKPLLYEGCHFFIWIFVFSLAISFSNRELVNRLYLKLTRFKPMYVFWSSEGSSAEECVANSIIKKYKLFKPNVVLAVWGRNTESTADICDKWKRGRRWIEVQPSEYDDVASYANVHFLLSADGMKNITNAMELMRHVKHCQICVRVDNVRPQYRKSFEEYVKKYEITHHDVCVWGISESDLAIVALDSVKEDIAEANNAFVVNFYKYNKMDVEPRDCDTIQVGNEIEWTEKIATYLGFPVLIHDTVLNGDKQPAFLFYGEDRCALLEVFEQVKKKIGNNMKAYVYISDELFATMVESCYGFGVVGTESALFTEEMITSLANKRRTACT